MNNRQSGRRRGRGGQRSQQGQGRGPEQGNRIDNRARGNAAQLHEKYKNLARDAQTQGDRVMAEYYFQFADHYFRVLNEGRARFEENRRQRDDVQDDEDLGEEVRADEAADEVEERDEDDSYRRERRDRQPRHEVRDTSVEEQAFSGEPDARFVEAPQGEGRPRARLRRNDKAGTNGHAVEGAAELGLDADRLPPALSVGTEDEAPAPKPRARRSRKTAEADVAAES